MTKPTKKARGFVLLPPERRREISALGGRAAHAKGTAHVFTSDAAREAAIKMHAGRRKAAKP